MQKSDLEMIESSINKTRLLDAVLKPKSILMSIDSEYGTGVMRNRVNKYEALVNRKCIIQFLYLLCFLFVYFFPMISV